MDTAELLKQVRRIEIKTRRLSANIFAGEYHSAFKGQGLSFAEVKEYTVGDDVRNIDWNVTARYNRPFIKTFEEERELTVMLLIDVSGSREFGTTGKHKQSIMTEIAATLSFSAIQNGDKIGVMFFSDKIEKFIAPKKGTSHIIRIIRELIDFQPERRATDIGEALRFLTNALKKRTTVFVLSDFLDEHDFNQALMVSNNKHDVSAIRIYDPVEMSLPPVGLIQLRDAETDQTYWVNSSSSKVQRKFKEVQRKYLQALQETFSKSGIDYVSIATNEDYVKKMVELFKIRERRR